MHVRFWGTRGSIPAPGPRTVAYGGNTSCVEIRTTAGMRIILDCGTGIRELGQEILRSKEIAPIYLLIGHSHWDHIQGFPFFAPAFDPKFSLNIFAMRGFQKGLEEVLAGLMQYSYFPVKLNDLPSRIQYTELEEGFFRIGEILVETQCLNHTAPTIGYRISDGVTTIAYITDHEPFWNISGPKFLHPGDQRHIAFMKDADLVIHDAQYTAEEFKTKRGWGHSPIEYVTDVAVAAGAKRLALFHHDPARDDSAIQRLEKVARTQAAARGSSMEVFAAAEGQDIDIVGTGMEITITDASATKRRPIKGRSVLVIAGNPVEQTSIAKILAEDELLITPVSNCAQALKVASGLGLHMIILREDENGSESRYVRMLRNVCANPDLPVLLLTDQRIEFHGRQDAMATDYLAMPFSPPMLRGRVRAWLARSMESALSDVPSAAAKKSSPARSVNSASGAERSDVIKVLSSMGPFRSLSANELSQLVSKSAEVVYAANTTILRQGEHADSVYIVLSGRIRVVQTSPETGAKTTLAELGPGEIFGELGVLREKPRSATILTTEQTQCLKTPAADFLAVVDSSTEVSLALLRVMSSRSG
jgi:phosphoribosyl 1,2-cyclic phosphodiesterase/DNA-binding response OmpR family regulator